MSNGNGKNGGADEMIDITTSSRLLLTRLAVVRQNMRPVMYPRHYNPSQRADTREYVQRRTQYAKNMVSRQDTMVFNLRTMRNEMDQLDTEVEKLLEDNHKITRARKYKALEHPDEFVSKYSTKYDYNDF